MSFMLGYDLFNVKNILSLYFPKVFGESVLCRLYTQERFCNVYNLSHLPTYLQVQAYILLYYK